MSATTCCSGISPIEIERTESTPISNSARIDATTHTALPETLKKFCLLGKVVVVTGYVPCHLSAPRSTKF